MTTIKTVFTNSTISREDVTAFSLKDYARAHGVFTTFIAEYQEGNGAYKVAALNYHLERLVSNAKALGIYNPNISEHRINFIEQQLFECLGQPRLPSSLPNRLPTKRVRIIVLKDQLEIVTDDYTRPWAADQAIKVMTFVGQRENPQIKSTNMQVCFAAREYAQQNGAQEAFLVSTDGQLLEGTSSNIFWFDAEGRLYTIQCNSIRANVLPGITRRVILENQNCIECEITLEEFLVTAKEAFITQSTTGITPVSHINDTIVLGGNLASRINFKL